MNKMEGMNACLFMYIHLFSSNIFIKMITKPTTNQYKNKIN